MVSEASSTDSNVSCVISIPLTMPSFIHDLNKSQLIMLYFAEGKSCTFCANFTADLNLKSFLFILFSLSALSPDL